MLEKTLPRAPTRYVELIAVMAQYNPFAEKAGMKKIAVKEGNPEAFSIADVLRELRFNMQILGSKRYLSKKLGTLRDSEINQIRKVFLENRHPKFQKAFQPGTPYGTGESYEKLISGATQEDIVKLIVYVSQLLQTKVYLFYGREA